LIKQGATPVTEADDIASVLRPIIGGDLPAREDDSDETEKSSAEPAPDERARVIALLSPLRRAISASSCVKEAIYCAA
jgi:predicted Rossmann fold nucleotide-binding protein DprA/Smf involved in DNA uptake